MPKTITLSFPADNPPEAIRAIQLVADELAEAHAALDTAGIPRESGRGAPYSLTERILTLQEWAASGWLAQEATEASEETRESAGRGAVDFSLLWWGRSGHA